MRPETQKIIDDLEKSGFDMTSIRRQIATDPTLDKQADVHLGGGILRQSEYTRYMNQLKEDEARIQRQAQELATLHDAAAQGTELPQAALETIQKLEDALIETGMFDEESVKKVSFIGKKPLIDATTKKQIPPLQQNPPVTPPVSKENEMSRNFDESKFVDVDTHRASLANMAYGGIATNLEINAALDEIRSLGIKVDRTAVRKLQDNLRTGYQAGKDLDTIIDETFEVTKAREAQQNEAIEKRIQEAKDLGRAEALKEAGIPVQRRFNNRNHPILDRKSLNRTTPPPPNGNPQNNQNPPAESGEKKIDTANQTPINKYGDPEVFRNRRGRDERLQNAVQVYDEVMEHYANDPTFVE
jgi:hypothetical protein